jgi:protoporphyrin/coproporphyrin ferrochelatase
VKKSGARSQKQEAGDITGVLLFNLGGPENLDEVRPFLYNLFSDPEIIRIKNDRIRRVLAWVIASARQRKSRDLYRQIGGGSPLRRITESQASALESTLGSRGYPAHVYTGMRCWNPTIDEAVQKIRHDHITNLTLLPLFPQFSVTTTGSALKRFHELDRNFGLSEKIGISIVESWFDEPLYIQTVAELIREELSRFSQDGLGVHIVYSAHSIPARYVEEGDPYLEQTQRSVALIDPLIGISHGSDLAFQSKVGPVKWLGPSTKDVLTGLGRKGVRKVLTVPISFVSDHIETLQEIDITYKRLAVASGIVEFRRSASPNLHPKFINALAQLVLKNRARGQS